MALAISINRKQFRYGSSIFPIITTDGYAASQGMLKMGELKFYPFLQNEIFTLPLPNKSDSALTFFLREAVAASSWELDTNIEAVLGYANRSIRRTSGSGYDGAYFDTALDGEKCTFQARIPGTEYLSGVSLQNGDDTIVHDYTNAAATHSVTFNYNGIGEIRELGELVAAGAYFEYEQGDTILLELDAGVLKYYLVKNTSGDLVLLRTTRSKLTADPKIEVMCHDDDSGFDQIVYTETEEVTASIEVVATLENFQDWNNEYFISSTADAIVMANNEPQFTFPNPKTRLRSINANLAMRNKTFRLEYEEFFNWHGIEREFLFVDKAKTDADDNAVEWWAKFASPFGDRSRNSCLSSHSAQIVESYRRDYVPIQTDVDDPVLTFTDDWSGSITGNQYLYCAYTEAIGGLLKTAQLYMNGDPVGDEVVIDPVMIDYTNQVFGLNLDTTQFANGGYAWYWKGTDYAGNVGQSNTLLLTVVN